MAAALSAIGVVHHHYMYLIGWPARLSAHVECAAKELAEGLPYTYIDIIA